ncbi:MAG: hypothetical protein KME55_42095 [Nostoc indistinguendum CM1-VF10]|nr:hypothetical protein [Nostoc indistinguendum CM1-VF10]
MHSRFDAYGNQERCTPHLPSPEAVFVSFGEGLSFLYRHPRPHAYPSNNRPPQSTIAPWGNGNDRRTNGNNCSQNMTRIGIQ